MAELTNDCCAPDAQATCCELTVKRDCCGHGDRCACSGDTPPSEPLARRSYALQRLDDHGGRPRSTGGLVDGQAQLQV